MLCCVVMCRIKLLMQGTKVYAYGRRYSAVLLAHEYFSLHKRIIVHLCTHIRSVVMDLTEHTSMCCRRMQDGTIWFRLLDGWTLAMTPEGSQRMLRPISDAQPLACKVRADSEMRICLCICIYACIYGYIYSRRNKINEFILF